MTNWAEHFRAASRRASSSSADFGASGDFGADAGSVAAVQHALNALGYNPPLKEDGVAGPATAAAVTAYQRTHGLTVDGVIGPQVLHTLGITSGAPSPLPTVPMPPVPGLKAAVSDHFVPFSQKFEGHVNYMYTDSKGLVTTGLGNLIDPISQALTLPWKHADGSPATPAEIQAEFIKIKSAWPKIQSIGDKAIATLFLSDVDIASLVHSKLAQNHNYLQTQFPNITAWPADAQLAVHSISWAWGPGFTRVWGALGNAFKAAVNATTPDFAKAADIMTQASQHEESINPGIVPRNAANKSMFANADALVKKGESGDDLFWPGVPAGAAAAIALVGSALTYWLVGGGIVIGLALLMGHRHGVLR